MGLARLPSPSLPGGGAHLGMAPRGQRLAAVLASQAESVPVFAQGAHLLSWAGGQCQRSAPAPHAQPLLPPRSRAASAPGSPSPPPWSRVAAPTIHFSSPWVTAWTRQPGRPSSSNLPLPGTCPPHMAPDPPGGPCRSQQSPSPRLRGVAPSLQTPGGEASPCGPPGDRAGRWQSIFGLHTLS